MITAIRMELASHPQRLTPRLTAYNFPPCSITKTYVIRYSGSLACCIVYLNITRLFCEKFAAFEVLNDRKVITSRSR